MKIKCILVREGGTRVEIDGVDYHFKPQPPIGEHIAEVTNPDHIDRFLSISEGYRVATVDDDTVAKSAADADAAKARDLAEEKVREDAAKAEEEAKRQATTEEAAERERLEAEEKVRKEAEERDAKEKTEKAAAEQRGDSLDDLDRDALADLYEKRFSARPPARIQKAALVSALRAQA